jgi:spore germination cell wall hydrolase CwlJ-like protein
VAALVLAVGAVTAAAAQDAVPPPPVPAAAAAGVEKAKVLQTKAAESGGKPEATPAQRITKPEAQAVDPHGQKPMDDPLTCLARTIYWEARGEDQAGMEAIASVVMNRVGKQDFPDTVCGVVKQGQEKHACQFSWWCDGKPDTVQNEEDRYTIAKDVARKALNGQLPDRTKGALYFVAKDSAKPDWASKYVRTAQIDGQDFYKPRNSKAQ